MWTEDELKKDATGIQRSIQDLTRDYHKQLSRSIQSRIHENKEKTTDFLHHFYERLRNAEFEVYQKMTNKEEETPHRIAFQLTEIKNSDTDLPHPRILSELKRSYDMRRHNSDGDDDRYIPYKVYAYIREKSEYCIQFHCVIGGRAISLYFITFPDSHISVCNKNGSENVCAAEIALFQVYAYKVFLWLSLVTRMADKECSEKELNVYFYMTPFKKQRPTRDTVLSAIHVNTGLTRNCETRGEIVVYRAEEWFKVFVHESMHNFNMDFIGMDLHDANEQLRRTFCIPHDDILLFETYTETWARIINTIFDTYFQEKTTMKHKRVATAATAAMTRTQFVHTVQEKLKNNALFYAYQIVKVLNVMGLTYANITIQSSENREVCRERYAEKTNVYAYYILGGILSVYALPFLSWCCLHNNNSGGIGAVRFSHLDNRRLQRFVDFIADGARDPILLSMISFIQRSSSSVHFTVLKNTMRMTMD